MSANEWVPTEPGAPPLQASPDLRFLGTTRSWRGGKSFAIAFLSSTFRILRSESTGFEGRSLVKWELRSVPWFVVSLSSLMEDSGGERAESGENSNAFSRFVSADAASSGESSEWVPAEPGAPSLQSSSDLRLTGTIRSWRG